MSLAELKKILKNKKIVIGTKQTIKNIKLGKTTKVFIASNCPTETIEKIEIYAKLTQKFETTILKQPSHEIGMICKKQYPISILSY